MDLGFRVVELRTRLVDLGVWAWDLGFRVYPS